MKRFLRINIRDKQFVKMINQSSKGFELVILDPKLLEEINNTLTSCKEKGDDIDVVWQMKFKRDNFVVYKNCIFSEPVDNFFKETPRKYTWFSPPNSSKETNEPKLCGKKFKVKCSGVSYFSNSSQYKNRLVHLPTYPAAKLSENEMKYKYKDGKLLDRMLKIGELNYKSSEYEL